MDGSAQYLEYFWTRGGVGVGGGGGRWGGVGAGIGGGWVVWEGTPVYGGGGGGGGHLYTAASWVTITLINVALFVENLLRITLS